MIPQIIHYIWLGGNNSKPKLIKDCIESWKRFCPDWEIIEWNESNLNLKANDWVRKSIENKKFGFTVDYFRWYLLAQFGGVYLDADTELIAPLDDFLENKFFTGLESYDMVGCGIIGSSKGSEISSGLEKYYSNLSFTLVASPYIVSSFLKQHYTILDTPDIQAFEKLTIYPKTYFYPKTFGYELNPDLIKENTKAIHHYLGSWLVNPAENLQTYNTYDT